MHHLQVGREEALRQGLVQITPVGIDRLDELQLPGPVPRLDRRLPRDRQAHLVVVFIPDQQGDGIFAHEGRAGECGGVEHDTLIRGTLAPSKRSSRSRPSGQVKVMCCT